MAEAQRLAHHNNFGALRLILAYAVILSHSPEMLDGSRAREPLVGLGSHITLGGLAVDGFFIISGYLIAASFLSSRSLLVFLRSRVLRIYPAFLLAFAICLLIVGPIGGGDLRALGLHGGLLEAGKALILVEPSLPGALHSLPIPSLDGSMWTIRYEFRCYLVVALLGVVGLLDRRGQVLGLTILCYLIAAALNFSGGLSMRAGLLHQFVFGVIGDPALLVPLLAIFLSGVCAFLYRDRISFRGAALALSAAVSLVAILALPFPEAAIGTAGCYFLLWVGLGLKSKFLEKINNDYDFSYGVYLYAWPIAALIMLASQRAHLNLSPSALTGLTAVLSTVAGAVSWYGLERPALKRKSKRSRMKRIAIA